jgi:hypothetical protein
MDVITAAKKISEAGTKLDKLTRMIADQCPESSTKKDLLAYLQRIALYCHQLNITSKVKADVQNISGELIVSGVSFFIVFIDYPGLMHIFHVPVGQCNIFNPSSKEFNECSGANSQIFIRCFNQISSPGHSIGKIPRLYS